MIKAPENGGSPRLGDVIIVVQPQGAHPGNKLSGIRDFLAAQGANNALAFDGSTSAFLVEDSNVVIAPGTDKDISLESAIGFRVRK